MKRMSTRSSSSSSSSAPAQAPPLEDEHLLEEILRRGGPQPSSLVRAAAVSRPWQRLTADPEFLRRFREHHRTPPLLGVFHSRAVIQTTPAWDPMASLPRRDTVFISVMDTPNRIHEERFELGVRHGWVLDCRNGLVLVRDRAYYWRPELIVWDPMPNLLHRLPDVATANSIEIINGAVLCAAGDSDQGHVHGHCSSNDYKVVVLCLYSGQGHARIFSSRTGLWGDVQIKIADRRYLYGPAYGTIATPPATLIANALHWLSDRDPHVILQCNLDSQSISAIQGPPMPDQYEAEHRRAPSQIMRADNGAIGFAILQYQLLRVWQRNVKARGVATWVLRSTLRLHDILGVPLLFRVIGMAGGRSMCAREQKSTFDGRRDIVGYSEDTDTIFILVDSHVYMLHVKSLEYKRLGYADRYYPFTSFYSPATPH